MSTAEPSFSWGADVNRRNGSSSGTSGLRESTPQ